MASSQTAYPSVVVLLNRFFPLAFALILLPDLFAQTRVVRTDPSLLQPEMEAQITGVDASDYLTGDWEGLRSKLHVQGIDFFGFYNAIINGNVVGGFDPGHATYDHDIWLGAKFDLQKLVGWTGGLFAISFIDRAGDDNTTEHIGSIYSTQQLVGGQRAFLYQVFLEQKFGKQLTLKVGRYGASDDFNTSPLYGYALNNGIDGNIRNVLFDTRFSAYPFAVWAASAFVDPTPEFHLKAGVFQVSEGMFENDDNGLNFGIGDRDGYLAIAQFAWMPEFCKTPMPSSGDAKSSPVTSKGMPGHYWLGATFSQWDLYQKFSGGFLDHSFGFYAHADQMVYREAIGSDQGLTVFVASGYYPQEEISRVPFQINAGLNYQGLFPSRDKDRTILYFIYGDISSDYARSVQLPGEHRATSEKVIEVGHRFQVTKWSYIQPDVQWVIDPGGTGDIPNAVVIGAQMGVTF
jgi:porin